MSYQNDISKWDKILQKFTCFNGGDLSTQFAYFMKQYSTVLSRRSPALQLRRLHTLLLYAAVHETVSEPQTPPHSPPRSRAPSPPPAAAESPFDLLIHALSGVSVVPVPCDLSFTSPLRSSNRSNQSVPASPARSHHPSRSPFASAPASPQRHLNPSLLSQDTSMKASQISASASSIAVSTSDSVYYTPSTGSLRDDAMQYRDLYTAVFTGITGVDFTRKDWSILELLLKRDREKIEGAAVEGQDGIYVTARDVGNDPFIYIWSEAKNTWQKVVGSAEPNVAPPTWSSILPYVGYVNLKLQFEYEKPYRFYYQFLEQHQYLEDQLLKQFQLMQFNQTFLFAALYVFIEKIFETLCSTQKQMNVLNPKIFSKKMSHEGHPALRIRLESPIQYSHLGGPEALLQGVFVICFDYVNWFSSAEPNDIGCFLNLSCAFYLAVLAAENNYSVTQDRQQFIFHNGLSASYLSGQTQISLKTQQYTREVLDLFKQHYPDALSTKEP